MSSSTGIGGNVQSGSIVWVVVAQPLIPKNSRPLAAATFLKFPLIFRVLPALLGLGLLRLAGSLAVGSLGLHRLLRPSSPLSRRRERHLEVGQSTPQHRKCKRSCRREIALEVKHRGSPW